MNAAVVIAELKAMADPRAVAVWQQTGKVVVGYGETSCQAPDAVAYLERARKKFK